MLPKRRWIYLLAVLGAALLTACAGTDATPPPTLTPGTTLSDLAATTPPTLAASPTEAVDVGAPTATPDSGEAATAPAAPATDAPPAATPTPEAAAPQPVTAVDLRPVVDGLDKPVYLTHAGDERLFIVEQPGVIQIVRDGALLPEPFLDIRDRVNDGANEQGLLGLAFHPDYETNGRFFVNYTTDAGTTVIARYTVTGDADQADPASEVTLLTFEQPYNNHNGGQLAFGPDGYLYVGVGDGGSGGDPHGYGQALWIMLGSILRLDVDNGEPYGVPGDNPFVESEGTRPEIWAYGLRNPWRFSFDRQTGDLFISDVGQNRWEEVSWQPASSPGGENYGWNILEGTHCFQENCRADGTVLPIGEYGHELGCSVTGGYVYRGERYPTLMGNYFMADFCSGRIWRLFPNGDGTWSQAEVRQEPGALWSSFGEDARGEIYLLDHTGSVWQLASTS